MWVALANGSWNWCHVNYPLRMCQSMISCLLPLKSPYLWNNNWSAPRTNHRISACPPWMMPYHDSQKSRVSLVLSLEMQELLVQIKLLFCTLFCVCVCTIYGYFIDIWNHYWQKCDISLGQSTCERNISLVFIYPWVLLCQLYVIEGIFLLVFFFN